MHVSTARGSVYGLWTNSRQHFVIPHTSSLAVAPGRLGGHVGVRRQRMIIFSRPGCRQGHRVTSLCGTCPSACSRFAFYPDNTIMEIFLASLAAIG